MYVSINNYLTILILVETFYIELLLYKPFFSRVKTKQKKLNRRCVKQTEI